MGQGRASPPVKLHAGADTGWTEHKVGGTTRADSQSHLVAPLEQRVCHTTRADSQSHIVASLKQTVSRADGQSHH